MKGLSGRSRRIAGCAARSWLSSARQKAIPHLSDMDRAKIDGSDRVDRDGTCRNRCGGRLKKRTELKGEDWQHESSGAKPLVSLLATSLIKDMCVPSRYCKTDCASVLHVFPDREFLVRRLRTLGRQICRPQAAVLASEAINSWNCQYQCLRPSAFVERGCL
jgi:hypothetical protein